LDQASTALGLPVSKCEVDAGRVLYLAGENPDDVRMRWIVLAEKLGFDPKTIGVHFLPGVFRLSEIMPAVRKEIERIGDVERRFLFA
jgi:hypothetical protein